MVTQKDSTTGPKACLTPPAPEMVMLGSVGDAIAYLTKRLLVTY